MLAAPGAPTQVSEIGMPSNIVLMASLLVLVSGTVVAGDFVPRATGAYAPTADEAGARSLHMGSPASVTESPASSVRTPDTDSAPSTINPPRAAHLGADVVATDARALPPSTPAADGDEKPTPDPHKSRAARRWQSLLPGVMK
jgi:hypothetical protein